MGKVSAGATMSLVGYIAGPFEGLATPVQFEGPISVVNGLGVTHLRYRVVK
jgi:hypothetical protein